MTLNNKGLAVGILGNDTGAIDNFDRALSIDPNNTDSLVIKRTALGHQQKYEDAFLVLNKALSISPNDTEALTVSGIMFYEIGDEEDARSDIYKVLQIDPANSYAIGLSMKLGTD
jgi:tetratricopeptide (TPR) repeat protein